MKPEQNEQAHTHMLKTAHWVMLGFTALAVAVPFILSALTHEYSAAQITPVWYWLLVVAFIFINAVSIAWPLTGFITFGAITGVLALCIATELYRFGLSAWSVVSTFYLVSCALLVATTLYMKRMITATYRLDKIADQ